MASTGLSADRPIADAGDDELDRFPFARLLAQVALEAPAQDGFVMGLTGAWGSGKTSVLRLIEAEVGDQADVLWFNPWLFSGSEALVASFFAEIGGQLKNRKGQGALADSLASYADAVAPAATLLLGPLGGTLSLPKRLRQLKAKSARERYDELAEQLRARDQKILVFIDDFDRLTPSEIREVVRLVKAVGDLPRLVYVLAYDQPRVERALGESEGLSGREYLEKIVQSPHPLPQISKARLDQLALDTLQQGIGERELHHFDQDQWSLLAQAFLSFFATPRDAKRVANVAPVALDLAKEEVAAHDVLALTVLRVFEPAVHAALPTVVEALTGQSGVLDMRDNQAKREARKADLEALLQLAKNPEATRETLTALFPAASFGGGLHSGSGRHARARRRVASPPVFRAYLHAALDSDQLAFAQLDQVLDALADGPRLRQILEQVEDDELRDLLDQLRDHESRLPSEHPEVGAAEMLRLDPRLPERRGLFQVSSGFSLEGVLALLISQADDPQAAIVALFESGETLSQKWRVLSSFGNWADQESQPSDQASLNEDQTGELEAQLVAQIMQAEPEELAAEQHLIRLVGALLQTDAETASRRLLEAVRAHPPLFLAIARGSIRRAQSSSPPFNRARVDREALVALLGSEEVVDEQIRAIEDSADQQFEETIDLLRNPGERDPDWG